jgi:hypothetical protein
MEDNIKVGLQEIEDEQWIGLMWLKREKIECFF